MTDPTRVEDGGDPTFAPATGPDPRELAARDGVRFRVKVHEPGAERFEAARDRIEAGLDWGVGALVERDDELLLVRQDGRWMLPGGEVERGEGHAEALVRELDEETGLAVDPGPLRAVVENRYVRGEVAVGFHFALYDATACSRAVTDDPGLADEEIESVGWFGSLPADTLDRDLLVDLRRG
ncbi:NUDIX domain-containing protein [Salinirubellus sp. GCM10025818]|uniref:NUDIX domain-containing protein n=1 Tax=Salinirubellus TaxID=2162630 RepID=UPI0030D60846